MTDKGTLLRDIMNCYNEEKKRDAVEILQEEVKMYIDSDELISDASIGKSYHRYRESYGKEYCNIYTKLVAKMPSYNGIKLNTGIVKPSTINPKCYLDLEWK